MGGEDCRGPSQSPNLTVQVFRSKVFGFSLVKRCNHPLVPLPHLKILELNLIRKCIVNSSQFLFYVLATRFQFDNTSSNDFKVILEIKITMDDNERKKIKQLMREKGQVSIFSPGSIVDYLY